MWVIYGGIMKKIKNVQQGFTLLELLVVVLIIGILASIALPQYEMAVTKAKVASILPLMRRWKDALQEYKLQHGSYCKDNDCEEMPDASDLGVNWPSDWNDGECGDGISCANDYWDCSANEAGTGFVYCIHDISDGVLFHIFMYQPDDPDVDEDVRGITTCEAKGTEAEKVCKALGGKLLEDVWGSCISCNAYKLN